MTQTASHQQDAGATQEDAISISNRVAPLSLDHVLWDAEVYGAGGRSLSCWAVFPRLSKYAGAGVRLVSWNCQMGFRGRKVEALLDLGPDLAVIQECAKRDVDALAAAGYRVAWEGRSPGKGLGVIADPDTLISLDSCHDPELAYYLPLTASSAEWSFRLVATWAYGERSTTEKRWPLNDALAHCHHFLSHRPAIVVGDLNNHPIWDTPSRPTFQRSLEVLSRAGMRSAWHQRHGKEHGDEQCGTFYFYRHQDKPYYIDYCFVSSDISVDTATIGPPSRWLALSDHCPVIVDLQVP